MSDPQDPELPQEPAPLRRSEANQAEVQHRLDNHATAERARRRAAASNRESVADLLQQLVEQSIAQRDILQAILNELRRRS